MSIGLTVPKNKSTQTGTTGYPKRKSTFKKLILSRQTALLIFIATLSGHLGEVMIIYFSVLIHELAHLAVCIFKKIPASCITVYPYGMKLQLDKLTSPGEQILISIAGPAVNLLFFLIGKILESHGHREDYLLFFTGVNFLLFLFNMIPCIPLDGSEILRSLISCKKGIIYSYTSIIRISEIIMLFILICGCILTFRCGNISLFIVLSVSVKSIKSKKQEQILASKQIISGEISSQSIAKVIYAKPEEKAYEYLKHISFDYAMIILRSYGTPVTQQKLLDAVKHNPHIKIDDI